MAKKDNVLVSSKVKGLIKKGKCNTASDAMNGLNSYVYWLIDQACKRAKANGRKTVRSHDFTI